MPRDDADGEDTAAGSQASGSEPSPDAAAAARPADATAAADGGASAPGRPGEAAEMATHFRRVQELFGGGSEHQVAALARQLRTAVDVESVRVRLQCAPRLRRLMSSDCETHAVWPASQ